MLPQALRKCSMPGCPNNAHSRGLCRCHYGRFWRGKPLDGPAIQQAAPSSFNLISIERQLTDARRNHDLVVGVEGRMRWRRKIQELEETLAQSRAILDQQSMKHASVAAG